MVKSSVFGPFAGFSIFKKWFLPDLPLSIKPDNIYPMIVAGIKIFH
jgi:malate dehydrogenase (quinone)